MAYIFLLHLLSFSDCGMGVKRALRSCLFRDNEYTSNVVQLCYVLIISFV